MTLHDRAADLEPTRLILVERSDAQVIPLSERAQPEVPVGVDGGLDAYIVVKRGEKVTLKLRQLRLGKGLVELREVDVPPMVDLILPHLLCEKQRSKDGGLPRGGEQLSASVASQALDVYHRDHQAARGEMREGVHLDYR